MSYLDPEIKQELFAKHSLSKSAVDTGSPESQCALFTYRINHLTNHLKTNPKDHASRLGLLKLVGKRRSLLEYLQRHDIERYRTLIAALGIRK
jgi:small subunit ribosomal protein S15